MNCLYCLRFLDEHIAHYGLHPHCFSSWFGVSGLPSFLGLTRKAGRSSSSLFQSSPQNVSFFQGRFRKYSAELDGGFYILKMKEAEAPELPEVEYLCNQIGKQLNIPVAEFYLINFEGERVFVTKNFITPSSPIDLKHIYHFRSDEEHSCEGLIHVLASVTKRPFDVEVFLNTILFDALIGNHDRHGSNLALVVTSKETILSPIYDNVSYLSLEKGAMLKADFNPTGKVRTLLTSEPSMKDYVIEFKRLGYGSYAQAFCHQIKQVDLEGLIERSFCSTLMKEAFKKLFLKRYKELEIELDQKT